MNPIISSIIALSAMAAPALVTAYPSDTLIMRARQDVSIEICSKILKSGGSFEPISAFSDDFSLFFIDNDALVGIPMYIVLKGQPFHVEAYTLYEKDRTTGAWIMLSCSVKEIP